ncbi:MAG TPA: iron ABC transporter permease [Limnochordia bacterium]|jgi:iron(III) transport system permease protein|nr:iron ABC transporter permease [Limnochordia bacterium]
MALRPKESESRLRRFLSKDFTPYLVFSIPLIFMVIFLFWPLVTTFVRAFLPAGRQFTFGPFSLKNFERFATSNLYRMSLRNSFIVSFAVVISTLLIGVPMGYFVARVKMPFKNLILSLGILPVILPSFVGAFSWILLLGRQGLVRRWLNVFLGLFGLELPSIYGLFGVIFVMTVTYYPFVFLLAYGAFEAANPLLEEAAMIMGARRGRILRTVTLPLVLPSLGAGAILVFIRAMGNFGIPAILGGEEYVLPTLIYFRVNGFYDLNGAAAISLLSVAITGGALLLQKFVVSKREYETISASRSQFAQHTHPAIRIIATVFCLLVLLISLAPQITMIIMSFFTRWGRSGPEGFTLANYARIPEIAGKPILNSLYLSTAASLLCAVLGCLVAYITERRKPKGAIILDLAIMAPFILPGTVVSVAVISAFGSGSVFALSGTYTIILISYMIRRTPYVFRSAVASLSQLDPTLEEASMIAGANWLYTFRRVSLPLILPGIISGTILTFATLLQELSTTILLYSARTRTLPILIWGAVADGKFGEASALSTLLIAMVFIVVYVMNRFLGKSISSSFKVG